MTRFRRLPSEAGYTLVESAVATALFVTVAVPLSGATLYLLAARHNDPHLIALTIGRQVMERTLSRRHYVSERAWLDEGRWRVEQTVFHEGNRVILVVRVFRRHRPHPLVELMTVRLRT